MKFYNQIRTNKVGIKNRLEGDKNKICEDT